MFGIDGQHESVQVMFLDFIKTHNPYKKCCMFVLCVDVQGTMYQKTNALEEMNGLDRETFWAQLEVRTLLNSWLTHPGRACQYVGSVH